MVGHHVDGHAPVEAELGGVAVPAVDHLVGVEFDVVDDRQAGVRAADRRPVAGPASYLSVVSTLVGRSLALRAGRGSGAARPTRRRLLLPVVEGVEEYLAHVRLGHGPGVGPQEALLGLDGLSRQPVYVLFGDAREFFEAARQDVEIPL